MSFEQVFKRIDRLLRADSGCSTELDYIRQISWILFLKYINDYEIELEKKSKLSGHQYTPTIEKEYYWNGWAKVLGYKGMLFND